MFVVVFEGISFQFIYLGLLRFDLVLESKIEVDNQDFIAHQQQQQMK